MARGMEFDRDIAEPDLVAVANRLRRTGESLAIAQPHDVERFLRRQHRAVTGARMVGMPMRDDGPRDGADRIDMEAAGFAAKAGGDRFEDVLRTHPEGYRCASGLFQPCARPQSRALRLGPVKTKPPAARPGACLIQDAGAISISRLPAS